MIRIGEKLNSSIPRTAKMFAAKDEKAVIALIKRQEAGGADYLDINTAACEWGEMECMKWVIGLAAANSACGIMLDSPDPDVLLRASELVKGRKLILNSVTMTARFDELVPLCASAGYSVAALPFGDSLSAQAEERIQNALELTKKLKAAGIADENIYIDVIVESLATNGQSAANCLRTISRIKAEYPRVNTLAGLSNISFGLPERALINRTFLAGAVLAGLDAAIADVNDELLTDALYAASALAGTDEYCMEYIFRCREKAGE